MCVIIYKPTNRELPDRELLKLAYHVNHDGIGLVSPEVNYKGFSFDRFMRVLKTCKEKEPVLIHFRWATHGSIARKNCHPFHDSQTDTWFMHNGVLPIESSRDMTDSEIFFRSEVVPVLKAGQFLSNGKSPLDYFRLQEVIDPYASSNRFAMLCGRDVRLFGQWYGYDGLFCSNLRFLYHSMFV